jgi:hypothetical protein
VFTPASEPESWGRPETQRLEARVLADPFVPRLTNDPERPVLLFGPAPREPRRLSVVVMRLPG